MREAESVTVWIQQLKRDADSFAAQELWSRYLQDLVRVARRSLGAMPRRASDEEDVALSAFGAFFEGIKDGRFSRLDDRDDLWQILVMLADRKAITLRRRERAAKRGAGDVRGDSALGPRKGDRPIGFERVPAREPTPQLVAEIREQLASRMESLGDETLRRIARAKLEGFSNQEIAHQLQVGLRSVERKLDIIRRKWQQSTLE